MIDFSDFFLGIDKTSLSAYSDALHEAVNNRLHSRTYGELNDWLAIIEQLPDTEVKHADLSNDSIEIAAKNPLTDQQKSHLTSQLMGLHPWRKGPFNLFDLFIDTEWRSDWKWQRLKPHISDLSGRKVLDIGCGSGYHCWRMRGAGAELVVGIEPMLKFVLQFSVIKKYLPVEPVYVLPLLCEDMPPNMQCFDTVFSMGVLYHRRSPMEHLEELKQLLKPGGELVLETLVIDGGDQALLVPEGRYAKMRNVWFLPSVGQLEIWLKKIGFKDIRVVDVNQTTTEEQRTTDWMTFQSLGDFLDPIDPDFTIEGYPAPKRAIVIASK